MSIRRGLWLAPFGELAEPQAVVDLAARAEKAGWDGFFVWDHVRYGRARVPVADPWVVLAAAACATHSIALGTLVTPLARRHVHKLARETVSLDRLSGGRMVLGVGLGSGSLEELTLDEAPGDPRERAERLDEGLARLADYWSGSLQPAPVQQPRIPVWVASEWPHRRPLQRAARWDGWFPVGVESPEQLAEGASEVRRLRASETDAAYDVVAHGVPGDDHTPWEAAGATWWLVGFGPNPRSDDVAAAIGAGP